MYIYIFISAEKWEWVQGVIQYDFELLKLIHEFSHYVQEVQKLRFSPNKAHETVQKS